MSVDRFAILRVTVTGIKPMIKLKVAKPDRYTCPGNECDRNGFEFDEMGFCPRCGRKLKKMKTSYEKVELNARGIFEESNGGDLESGMPKLSKKALNFIERSTSFNPDDNTIGFYIAETDGVMHIKDDIYKRAKAWMKKSMPVLNEIAGVMGRTDGRIGHKIELYLDYNE